MRDDPYETPFSSVDEEDIKEFNDNHEDYYERDRFSFRFVFLFGLISWIVLTLLFLLAVHWFR